MAALLALQGVSKGFGSLRVIDELTLEVGAGEALGVIGPNGAGKTTALNLMIGRLRPERGAVIFAGRDITSAAPHARCRAGISLTHQIPHPFDALTVFENVLVGGVFGGESSERVAYGPAMAALELAGLAAKCNTRAGALTLLERKRLELARALATSPHLLLLDELMAGLNPVEAETAMALIRRLQSEGVTVLMVEHIVWALMSLSQRIIVLSAGEKIAEGPPEAVAADPTVVEVYLGHAQRR
jgi:branched-chain amino acid transport system ATP-binding protein